MCINENSYLSRLLLKAKLQMFIPHPHLEEVENDVYVLHNNQQAEIGTFSGISSSFEVVSKASIVFDC